MKGRFWWVWMIGLTFLVTWGVLYIGYMVDDRILDTVVLFAQAIILTLLTALNVVLFVPRDANRGLAASEPPMDSDRADQEQDWDQGRHMPVLASHTRTVAGSHHLDLRGLTITLLEMMALAERYDRNLTLVLMAVDDLDVVHDEYGERAATRVMEEVADLLSDALRIPDRSGIYAKNRFLVILPETTIDSGRQIAERVRRQVVDTEVRIDARRRISATVSSGVTGFKSGDDPQAILDRVENALNEAQVLGSNHSITWAPSVADTSVDSSSDGEPGMEVDDIAKLH